VYIIKGREPDLLESATDDMKSLVEDLPLLLLPSFIWEMERGRASPRG
jgi:hypothetical protein